MTTETTSRALMKSLVEKVFSVLEEHFARAKTDLERDKLLAKWAEEFAARPEVRKRARVARPLRQTRATKFDLIGLLPSIFLEKQHFPTNKHISDFTGNYLGLHIPNAEKKSRPELVGRIVAEVYAMDSTKLRTLLQVVEPFIGKMREGRVSDFFLEWDEAIRNLKLGRR